jgi:hypothetical protein
MHDGSDADLTLVLRADQKEQDSIMLDRAKITVGGADTCHR